MSVESVRAILAACPDDQWRAIVALSRFAGLRCPSEVAALRWGDVNWERGRLMVRSPKTAGHEGHAVRVVPLAPELRPILQDLFDHAEPGAVAVVPRLRDPKVNLRTQFERIIGKAGLTAWPRLFHNMRASCATDWVERFPAHVVAGWLGHSPLIAKCSTTCKPETPISTWRRAAGWSRWRPKPKTKKAARKAARRRREMRRSTRPPRIAPIRRNRRKALALLGFRKPTRASAKRLQNREVGDTGFEPVTSCVSCKRASQLRQSPGM